MSDEADFAGARDVRMQAAAWLERRNRSEWSAQDQAEFDAWLAASPSNTISYLRVEAAWNRAHRLGVLRQPARNAEAPAPQHRSTRLLTFVAAFAGAIAIFGAVGTAYVLMPRESSYATGVGGHEILPLKDGSQIELNTDTVVRVSTNTSRREAWLDKGEAYFRIKHDPAHPFVVIAGNHRITDLGTTFLVRRDSDRVRVALIEGRARIDALDGANHQHATLKPGDVVLASARAMSISKEDTINLTAGLGWRHGLLIFKYTTLADAAAEFNRYNGNKLVIADPAVGRLKIVGTFATNNVAAFADVAEDVLHLKVTHMEDQIVIAR